MLEVNENLHNPGLHGGELFASPRDAATFVRVPSVLTLVAILAWSLEMGDAFGVTFGGGRSGGDVALVRSGGTSRASARKRGSKPPTVPRRL